MFRPAVHKITGALETIEIESCQNIEDYIIIGISKEANQASMSLNGDTVDQERPTRSIALAQEEAYENANIEKAVEENKARRKSNK